MPLLCMHGDPIQVDAIARLRYSGFLAQCRVRSSVVAVEPESSEEKPILGYTSQRTGLKYERAQVACQEAYEDPLQIMSSPIKRF